MKSEEWFRRTAWNPEIEAAFEARLRRSRSDFGKAQYLMIQGGTLIGSGRTDLIRVGMRLTERVLTEYPDECTLSSQCLHALGIAHERLGENERAIECYRKAWDFEREYPNSISGARDDLALLIVRLDRRADADEALAAIEPRSSVDDYLFPIVLMRRRLVRATVASWRGDFRAAAEYARQGLQAASMTRSPLRHHPTLGLVGKQSDADVAALRRLAGL